MQSPWIETAVACAAPLRDVQAIEEHILEIVSDSGEGAQTCGQMFADICARTGYGVWTVEIIPAEIEPPSRSRAGASGNRIRFGSEPVSNSGDGAALVVALNEQVLYSRIDADALASGALVIVNSVWAEHVDEEIRARYSEAIADFRTQGYRVVEIPIEQECRRFADDPRKGTNMWVLGLLCSVYCLERSAVHANIANRFAKKGNAVVRKNLDLFEAGYGWSQENLEYRFHAVARKDPRQMVAMNGNQALALGAMAAGIEVCSMYPITPATSASHFLASMFEQAGGFVHQAEDEIAAIGFAIGCSYAGKTALTITSGPGLALKTEFLGLAVMAEVPLVVVVVQRGGPSTGLPTKIEQGDLLAAMFASPGDSPKIVIAPATIEECFHFMIMARQLAEDFRGPVMILSDANLATGQQPFQKPELSEAWFAPPVDQSRWDRDVSPFEWDEETGLSRRPIPGQPGGEYVLTGLAHNERSRVAYESAVNQHAMRMRSRKLAVLQSALKAPAIHGDPEGDLLVIGWGSTLGAIEEAVGRLRAEGRKISSIHLRFLSPFGPGLGEIVHRFRRIVTVEVNYSDDAGDPYITPESRRYSQLAMLLRAHTLADIDCWSRVPGSPIPPAAIEAELRRRLDAMGEVK